MSWRRALCIGGLLLAAGCNAGRVFIASPGDYADYRRVRVAESADERLARAWEYLQDHPDGSYTERLQRYFDKAEPAFYRVRRRSAKGLEAYLRALPDGPHAEQALARLMDLRTERRREELDTRMARQTGMRLDLERSQRAAAAELLGWWLSQLLDRAVWQAPWSEAPGELLVRYSLALPVPSCEPDEDDGERCVKLVAGAYRVRAQGKRVDRQVAFDLELAFAASGRLRGVTIMGNSLFVRGLEAQRQEALDETPQQGREAVSLFVAWLSAHLADRDVACSGGSEPDGSTVLDCEGLRLTIEPGQGGGDDLLLIGPVPSQLPAEELPAEELPAEEPPAGARPAEERPSEGPSSDDGADEGSPYD